MADKLIRANGNIVINDDRSSSTSNDRWDIGDVRASLLTRTQFQARNGTDWELLDGTDVSGSALDTLVTLGSGLLPDATDKFLRMDGTNAQSLAATIAGSTQGEDTKLNGITVSGGTASGTFAHKDHDHTAGNMVARITVNSGQNVHYQARSGVSSWNATRMLNFGAPDQGTAGTGLTEGADVEGTVADNTSDASLSSTPASISDNSAVETRPINITVNYFVKIN
jgi:hypothetical protein